MFLGGRRTLPRTSQTLMIFSILVVGHAVRAHLFLIIRENPIKGNVCLWSREGLG